MKKRAIFFILAITFAKQAQALVTCSWLADNTVAEHFKHWDKVFIGQLMTEDDQIEGDNDHLIRKATLKVLKSYKGVQDGGPIILIQNYYGWCTADYGFQKGKTYMIYGASTREGFLEVSQCSLTKELVDATEDVRLLESGVLVAPKGGMGKENRESCPRDGLNQIHYRTGHLLAEQKFQDCRQNGLTKFYYENGALWAEINYKNGQREGPAHFYQMDGSLKRDITFKDDKIDGPEKIYFDNGQVAKEGIKDPEYPGERWIQYREYNEQGRLLKESNADFYAEYAYFDSGNQHTVYESKNGDESQKEFYPDGRLKFEVTLLSGMIKEYYENGYLKIESNFDPDRVKKFVQAAKLLSGAEKYLLSSKEFDPNGRLIVEETWEYDREGKHYTRSTRKEFDPEGRLLRKRTFKYPKNNIFYSGGRPVPK